ncbi:MAG: TadE family protein [Chloroflexota bacterium]
MTAFRRRVGDGSRGQTLSEFALVIPLILLIFLGLFDLGRAVYAYTTISNAAREGARVLIVDQSQASGVYKAQTEAADTAFALGIAPGSVTVTFRSPDLSSSCTDRTIGCVAEVSVPYSYSAITPIIGQLVGPISMSSTVRIPIERTNP